MQIVFKYPDIGALASTELPFLLLTFPYPNNSICQEWLQRGSSWKWAPQNIYKYSVKYSENILSLKSNRFRFKISGRPKSNIFMIIMSKKTIMTYIFTGCPYLVFFGQSGKYKSNISMKSAFKAFFYLTASHLRVAPLGLSSSCTLYSFQFLLGNFKDSIDFVSVFGHTSPFLLQNHLSLLLYRLCIISLS